MSTSLLLHFEGAKNILSKLSKVKLHYIHETHFYFILKNVKFIPRDILVISLAIRPV